MAMRTNRNEKRSIFINSLIKRSKITGNVNAAISGIFTFKFVIVKNWIFGIFDKKAQTLLHLFLFAKLQFPISFLKAVVENNAHIICSNSRELRLRLQKHGKYSFSPDNPRLLSLILPILLA